MTEYVYKMILRPPDPGAVPREGLIRVDDVESWKGSRRYWGHAVYDRRLSREETEHYDMEFCREIKERSEQR